MFEIQKCHLVIDLLSGLLYHAYNSRYCSEGGLYVKRKAGERLFFRKCRMENDQSSGCKIGEKVSL